MRTGRIGQARRGVVISLAAAFLTVFAATAQAQGAPDSFADLAERLSPAVVNISTSQVLGSERQAIPGVPEDSPLNDFFKDFMEQQGQRPQRVQSLGSGFVIDPAGVIITNNHVIDGADRIEVVFMDGTTLPATLTGRDPKTDIAVLKVESQTPLPHVELGDSSRARVGDWVIAIGNPFGLGGTVTAGIISALNRDIHAGNYDDFIQTDASINRGNSGGPLFDMQGRVVGVNSAIISPSGASVGIGFAVPTSTVRPIVEQILEHGETRRGWIGVRIQTVTPEIADSLGLAPARGALIAGLSDDGPAAAAGIEPGDIVLSFDGRNIAAMRDLPRIVAETGIGRTVDVEIYRGGRTIGVKVTVARLDESEAAAAAPPADTAPAPARMVVLGLSLAELTATTREGFDIDPETRGVLVTDVDPLSGAAEKGVRPGDVIVQIAQRDVATPADVERIVAAEEKAGRNTVLLRLSSGGDLRFVALRLGGL
ncbi:DegQ family serine endoprotease [uncultured Parvibaculum sp.]|uniref:DegQ family serine endoprotease n=1 Tax=uncultured Parvibaculum sp. TaxID=291828 RepID=UPI0030EE6A50|tara:strand:- start:7044 stop:8492 length:1449 start_codon:yes stop_codon:yes gene_type:complete